MSGNNKWHISIFFVLLISGSYLRLYNLNNTLLWQDEAETAFYARQILDFRLPNAYDEKRDLFLYIGAFIPISPSDSHSGLIDPTIYEFVQEDFANDGTLIKHPYGDILLTALSFSIFGPSTFSARFLFALTGVFSLILVYQLGRYLYNKRVGLIAMAFQTFNIVLIAYERQARYYSLNLFGFLGALYFGLRAVEEDELKSYFLATLFLMLLVCTNPVTALTSVIVLFVYHCYCKKTIKWILDKKLSYCVLLLLAFMFIYGLLYQPWRAWYTTAVHFPLFIKFIRVAQFVVTFSIDCSFLLVCSGIVTQLYYRERPDVLVIVVFLFSLLINPFLIFYTSLYERTMVAIIPFLSITIARFLCELYRLLQGLRLNKFLKKTLFCCVMFTGLIFPMSFSFPSNIIDRYCRYPLLRDIPSPINLLYYLKFINGKESDDFLHRKELDSRWVTEAIEFLESKEVSGDEWVFTTFNNAVFLFYSDLKVQLVWPIRKSFLDSYHERFWILIGPYAHELLTCHWFYKFSGGEEMCKNPNYEDRIKTARRYDLPSGAVVYECNASL